jgi:hypothetical protein
MNHEAERLFRNHAITKRARDFIVDRLLTDGSLTAETRETFEEASVELGTKLELLERQIKELPKPWNIS